tara:strand:- start:404 stop:811 length:408 start_codon:yes stop_codon:yes gene_type:complete
MKSTFKVNQSVLNSEFDKIRDWADMQAKDLAEDIADSAITFSTPFVDTGAYITSFSFSTGAGRPRGKSSSRKQRNQPPAQKANEGRALLAADLSKINFEEVSIVTLRNGAPHGSSENWGVERNHRVFERLRIKYG